MELLANDSLCSETLDLDIALGLTDTALDDVQ